MEITPTRKQLQNALAVYVKPDTAQGIQLFVVDLITYILAITLVLASSLWYLQLIGGILAGIKMANLTTLAHDASHNSLTRSKLLNKVIAIVSFAPGLFNYALWLYDHHVLHHHITNEEHPDSYVPLSKQEYDSLTGWNKFKYRMYRVPTIWLFGIYYIVERWSQVKLFPRSYMPERVRRGAWRHFVFLLIYITSYLSLLVMAPLYSQTSTVAALVYGFVVPFYVYQSLYAFTVFVQHNNVRVPWFKGKRPRDGDGQQAYISVQLVFPAWFSWLVHHVYDHAAHHVHPAIPLYELPAAQRKLNEMLGARAVTSKFSFRWLYSTMRRCKLYDYDNHRWTDFSGLPTTRTTLGSVNGGQYDHEIRIERRQQFG